MKALVLFTILFVTIDIFLEGVSSISTLDNETYDVFVQLIKGEFAVPVKSRTNKQKSAVVRFWRNREKLSLKGGMLCFNGKRVVKREKLHDVVKRMYKSSKGSGVRKIYHKLKNSYSGVVERDVHEVLAKSTVHQRLNVRFENKARLRPVRARTVQIRHQIDLVDMQRLRTIYKGKTYKYVLSILDVFSRYHWLVPLQTKKSSHVARELVRIYREHGAPRVIQHDQGREFEGAVAALCKKLAIKVVKGRPYHPQSQGKVERAHRSFKKKIMHDFLVMGKADINWVKSLPEYARSLNEDPKEELSWKSPFEIYYGRKPNVAATGNPNVQEWDVASNKYHKMIRPCPKHYSEHEANLCAVRNLASSATRRCANRMVAGGERNNPPSIYKVGQTVLIRYPSKTKSVTKRHILEADVVARNVRLHKYKVAFLSPTTGKLINKWIPVSNVTSLTMEKEKQKRKNATKSAQKGSKKKAHRKKYLQAYDNQRSLFEDRAGSAHFIISYDPPKNGNCQFSAICKFLNSIGIHRSNQTIREDIVNYLENNPTAADGTPLQNFTDLPWPIYLSSMSQNGTFGDHITLQAASDLYNVEFQVLSSNGPGYTTTISPIVANPLCTFTLGHFAENDGEHYVCLAEEYNSSEINFEAECFADLQSDPSPVVGAPLSYDATQETDQGCEEERNEENDEHTCDKEPNPGKDDHERGNGLNPGNGDHARENRPNPGEGVRACQNKPHPENGDHTCENRPQLENDDDACENRQHPENGNHAYDQGFNPTNQPNVLSSSAGPYLNPCVLEEIIRQTLRMYPYTRPSLRAVSRFFKNIVDRETLPQVYIPQLNDFTDIRRVSVRKIMRLKGKNSGAVVRLREIINSVQWVSACLSFIAAGYGWFFITHIYWKQKSHY